MKKWGYNEMKIHVTLLILLLAFCATSQTDSGYRKLTQAEFMEQFDEKIQKQFNITFPICFVFEFNDKAGKHFLILTEKNGGDENNNDSIRAFCLKEEKERYKVQWTLNDFRLKQNEFYEEESIWFWTKYLTLKDLDADGILDPIVVYGTGASTGRIKIIVYHNQKKYVIRHQNGILDHERNTKVDTEFYTLPEKIQQEARTIMTKIQTDGNAIFPYGWEHAMTNKQTAFRQ